jgi:transcriptional regulator with XRE-family HTH domain
MEMPGKVAYKNPRQRRRVFFREWRKHRGLTQDQVAERMGTTKTRVSLKETGKEPWDQDYLNSLAHILACDPIDLLARNPGDPEAPWAIWDALRPDQRKRAIRVLKALADEEAA